MDRRSKLEVPIDFYLVSGETSYEGPEPTKIGSASALISKGGAAYDATSVPTATDNDPTMGNVSGRLRVFLRAHPGIELIDGTHWFMLPTMSDRFFVVREPDLRGVLPGRYPYRLEGEGN